jgi:uncharacterized protein (DUF2236 family)
MSISDAGLYGPDSITWRVHADPAMSAAGVRALFLQALHPRAIVAVAEHSQFRSDPWGRLFRTAEYVGVTTYGTTEAAARQSARVRRIHAAFEGTDDVTGERFRIDSPDLLLWVHCTEIESFLSTARRAGLRLSAAEADRYVSEQLRSARLVGLDPERDGVPRTVTELHDYYEDVRPQLRLTPAALDAARFLVNPPMPTWVRLATPAIPAWISLSALGFSLMPRWARRLYAVTALPSTDVAATLAVRALRTALLAVPPTLRDGPHVKDAKTRVATHAVRRLEPVDRVSDERTTGRRRTGSTRSVPVGT